MKPYSKEYGRRVSTIVTEAFLFPNFTPGTLPPLKYFTENAMWDTGAECNFIDIGVAEALELKPTSKKWAKGIGGEKLFDVYQISIGLPNGRILHDVEAYCEELGECDVLFGMGIITETDFLITNKDYKTVFSFNSPSKGNISL